MRPPRRIGAPPGEHDRVVRSRAVAWRRRARARRPSLPRRRRRRSTTTPRSIGRPAAHGRAVVAHGGRARIGGRRPLVQTGSPERPDGRRPARRSSRFAGSGLGVPRLRDVPRPLPGSPDHRRAQGEPAGARATHDRRRARGRRGRARCRSARSAGARLHAAREHEPRISHRRLARGGALGVVSLVGRLAARPRRHREFQVPERAGATTIISPEFIAARAARGPVPVKVWTVDDPDDMRRLDPTGASTASSPIGPIWPSPPFARRGHPEAGLGLTRRPLP